ncbi:MAG: DUF4157 domain-containing protein [Myxococcota bacterium]
MTPSPTSEPSDVEAVPRVPFSLSNIRVSGARGGQAVEPGLRRHMERAFGEDFSDVRLRPDSAEAAAVGAVAFTRRNEIHLAPGRVQPGDAQGRRVLAHEFAHVVQQRRGNVGVTRLIGGVAVNDEHALEQQADTLGDRAVRGLDARLPVGGPAMPGPMPGAMASAPAPAQCMFEEHSRRQLNRVIDDVTRPEHERLEAERELRGRDAMEAGRAEEARRMILAGRHDEALAHLHRNLRLAGNAASIRMTDDFKSVGADPQQVSRGGRNPFGVTVPGPHGPQIFIHREWMDQWARTNQMGNLVNTIEHESVHAGQARAGRHADDADAREFEAFSHEVLTAHSRLVQGQAENLPTSDQIRHAHRSALTHFGALDDATQRRLQPLKDALDRRVGGVTTMLEANDERTGAAQIIRDRFSDHERQAGALLREHQGIPATREHAERRERIRGQIDQQYRHMNRTFQDMSELDQRRHRRRLDAVDDVNRRLWMDR